MQNQLANVAGLQSLKQSTQYNRYYYLNTTNISTFYIGDARRKFGTRLKEHKTAVESTTIANLSPETNVHQVCLSRTNQH